LIASKLPLAGGDVARHYDELDSFYRAIWGEHVHHGLWQRGNETPEQAVRQLVELVARKAGIGAGSQVCDIGCGYGATARQLASEYSAQVTGVTISAAQHAYAIELNNAGYNPRYLHCDWLHNNLPDGAFDIAISVESSEHMPDKPAFFAQAHRILRGGGRLVICAWLANEDNSPSRNRWLIEPICREGRLPSMGTETDYRELLRAGGFVFESFEDLTSRVEKTWPICARRFLWHLARRPRTVRFLLDHHSENRIFALTIFRIWLAYALCALRYGIFVATKS
jgi:tocopherol O-methyltransferase